MNKENQIRVLDVIVLFIAGLIATRFDDPIEQLGIFSSPVASLSELGLATS